MKHIKLFEGFNKDEYYQRVDSEDSPLLNKDRFDDYEWVDLSSRVIDYLKGEIMYGWEISDSGRYRGFSFVKLSMNVYRRGKIVPVISCIIFESSDDWFWVSQTIHSDGYPAVPRQTYKCDQFEGLLKLLKDKGIIK